MTLEQTAILALCVALCSTSWVAYLLFERSYLRRKVREFRDSNDGLRASLDATRREADTWRGGYENAQLNIKTMAGKLGDIARLAMLQQPIK